MLFGFGDRVDSEGLSVPGIETTLEAWDLSASSGVELRGRCFVRFARESMIATFGKVEDVNSEL